MLRMYLAKKREDSALSMRKVADAVGIDVHHYQRIETGSIARVSFLILCKIALFLDISLFELYREESAYQAKRKDEWIDWDF